MINDRDYAIALTQVAEITPYTHLNQMPHTPKYVEGLLDLRGHMLPVVSLRTKMGMPRKENHETGSILILSHEGSSIGVLVDQVESVISAGPEHQMPVSPLIEGQEGTWVSEILLLEGRVILVLESESLVRITQSEKPREESTVQVDGDLEMKLDEGLANLIAMADPRGQEKVVPQIETVIAHTESEMTKVIDSIEAMLTGTDSTFTSINRFKQEVAMSGLKDFDSGLNELDGVTQTLQGEIFDLINQLQFQDIVRQKLERVLRHIHGMHSVIAVGLN
jgi:purine-binding chemotaxis protein CheW